MLLESVDGNGFPQGYEGDARYFFDPYKARLVITASTILGWSSATTGLTAASAPDVGLGRLGPNILVLRNGTNGQAFVISRTYTDASNYSQLAIVVTGSTVAFTTQEAGTGVGTITGITIDRPLTAGANAIKGLLTTNANATTGLIAGALAALTNASVVIYDDSGTAYRVPCVTP